MCGIVTCNSLIDTTICCIVCLNDTSTFSTSRNPCCKFETRSSTRRNVCFINSTNSFSMNYGNLGF